MQTLALPARNLPARNLPAGNLVAAVLLAAAVLLMVGAPAAHAAFSGERLWDKIYGGSGSDRLQEVCVDSHNNVLAAGDYAAGAAKGHDILVVKLSSSGARRWTRTYNGAGSDTDQAFGIATDRYGNAYVCGYIDRDPTAGVNQDMVTVKYDAAGRKRWARTYDGTAHATDQASEIVTDKYGYVYVTGHSQNSAGNLDVLTIKYDSAGRRKWTRRFSGSSAGDDIGAAVKLDGSRNVYVAGWSWSAISGTNGLLLKYNKYGVLKWNRVKNGVGAGTDRWQALTVSSTGTAYVAGYQYNGPVNGKDWAVARYDSAGNLTWQDLTPVDGGDSDDIAKSIAADKYGNIYVAGTIDTGALADIRVERYALATGTSWSFQYDGPPGLWDSASAVRVSKTGEVYVAGVSAWGDTGYDAALFKLSPAGALVWKRHYDGPGSGSDGAGSLALDSGGNPIIVGSVYTSAERGDADAFVARYYR